MISEIILDETIIRVNDYKETVVDNLVRISIKFNVKSEEYHDITTLLYKGTFDVQVPEKKLSFKATIQQYYTSVTNLYEENQIGDFSLSLLEERS